jgi:hypothetical protein
VSEPLVPRDEAQAALEARRELGPAYEEELAERFADRIEAKLKDRAPVRRGEQTTGIAVVSLVAAVPLLAIAGNYAGGVGVAFVCLALVLVNYFARR